MQEKFEIYSNIDPVKNSKNIVYRPLKEGVKLTYIRSKAYNVEFSGNEVELDRFIKKILFDPISQKVHKRTYNNEYAIKNHSFLIEHKMKKGVLDLEKEEILKFCNNIDNQKFNIQDIIISHLLYFFSNSSVNENEIIRDVCNPAIHEYKLIK